MKNNIVDTPVSLWEVLTSDNVIIPIFQRDYAQGRKGKEELRKKFLTELRTALEHSHDLHLDFVYGTKGEDGIYPLDGQQRMTTLWLLMWYAVFVDYKTKKYEKDDRLKVLGKFAYQTRPSSQNFVSWLCSDNFFNAINAYDESLNISEFIQGQNAFLSKWKQDPTIQAMLRMLSGTYAKKTVGNEDGIAQVFKDFNFAECKLFDKDCPIKFYNLHLDGIKDANNLYIKMNARGEQLTGFENFKADLIGHFSKNEDLKCFVDAKHDSYILSKWDCQWTDVFWAHRSGHDSVDSLFFAFIKRFLLNRIAAGVKEYNSEVSYEDYEKFLIDETSEYTTFDPYKPILTSECVKDLTIVLDSLHDNEELKRILSDRYVYPKYSEKEGLINFTRQDRVVMHGICRYLTICGEFNSLYFSHWLRVLKNLALYNEITDPLRFKDRIGLVEKVLNVMKNNNTYDIYALDTEKFDDNSGKETENSTQLEEEIKKISLIKGNEVGENTLKKLESLWVFEGRINCLLDEELLKNANLYGTLEYLFGTEGNNKVSECNGGKLVEFFQAVLSKYDYNDQTELIIYNEHNNLRKLLNVQFKDAFKAVIKELLGGKSINAIIEESTVADWRAPLIKHKELWNYSNKCKIKKVNDTWYLFKGSYKNDADIMLDSFDESRLGSIQK